MGTLQASGWRSSQCLSAAASRLFRLPGWRESYSDNHRHHLQFFQASLVMSYSVNHCHVQFIQRALVSRSSGWGSSPGRGQQTAPGSLCSKSCVNVSPTTGGQYQADAPVCVYVVVFLCLCMCLSTTAAVCLRPRPSVPGSVPAHSPSSPVLSRQ